MRALCPHKMYMYVPVVWHEADFKSLQSVKEIVESVKNLVVT